MGRANHRNDSQEIVTGEIGDYFCLQDTWTYTTTGEKCENIMLFNTE